jgi:hypothetical protein
MGDMASRYLQCRGNKQGRLFVVNWWCRTGGREVRVGEGKHALIEAHMAGGEHTPGDRIKTPVSTMV